MSKTITAADVRAIANLARLGVSDEEVLRATADLTNILGHFSALQTIMTTNVATSNNVSGLTNIVRPDVAKPNELANSDDLLSRAPRTQERYIKTPSPRGEALRGSPRL